MHKAEREELDYLSSTLRNYFYLRRKADEINQRIVMIEGVRDDSKVYIKGNAYDNVVAGSGCSVTVPKPMNIPYDVAELVNMMMKRDSYISKYTSLDRENRLNDRISKLSVESQIIINNIFQRELTVTEVAKIENMSKQTISNRLDRALKEMIRL